MKLNMNFDLYKNNVYNDIADLLEELIEDELNHMLRNFEEQIRMQGLSLEVFY